MIQLYDNPFSPFARKVRTVLDYKNLEFESIDTLALSEHERLVGVNIRAEVPALTDGVVTVVNSADIVAYLEHHYPNPSVYPDDPIVRACAREWERLADTVFDAIIHDVSLWFWPTHSRDDQPPPGLFEAGQRDVGTILAKMESKIAADSFLCGDLSIADFAMFPHVSSLRPLGMLPSEASSPAVAGWIRRMREIDVVAKDLAYVKTAAREKFVDGKSPYEGEKVVWRGDRMEWLFANGLHGWWSEELRSGRAIVPVMI